MHLDSSFETVEPGFKAIKNSAKNSKSSSWFRILGTKFIIILWVETDLFSLMKCCTIILEVVVRSSSKHLSNVLWPKMSLQDSPFCLNQSLAIRDLLRTGLSIYFKKPSNKLGLCTLSSSRSISFWKASGLFMKKSAMLYPFRFSWGWKNS